MNARAKKNNMLEKLASPTDEDKFWPSIEKRTAAQQRAEAAQYIASLLLELAQMASNCKLDTLNYLLTMAQMEAEVSARRFTQPRI